MLAMRPANGPTNLSEERGAGARRDAALAERDPFGEEVEPTLAIESTHLSRDTAVAYGRTDEFLPSIPRRRRSSRA